MKQLKQKTTKHDLQVEVQKFKKWFFMMTFEAKKGNMKAFVGKKSVLHNIK